MSTIICDTNMNSRLLGLVEKWILTIINTVNDQNYSTVKTTVESITRISEGVKISLTYYLLPQTLLKSKNTRCKDKIDCFYVVIP